MKADRNDLILDIAAEGFWDWDLKADTAFLSPRYCELVGYSPDDTVFDSNFFTTIIHPDDRAHVFKIIEEHLQGKRDHSVIEYRMISKDGTIRWIEGRGKIVDYDIQGTPVRMVGTIIETTQRKEAEAALRTSEERLSFALAASRMGVWEWNLQSNAVYWSPECCDVVGLQEFDGTFETFAGLLHPDDAGNAMDNVNKALAQRSFYHDEFRIILPDGEQRWLFNRGSATYDSNGLPLVLSGIVQNITERKLTEETVTNSNKLLQTIINTAPMRVFWKDKNLNYLGCNLAFARDAGVACPDDLIGKDDFQLAWEEVAESYRSDDRSVIDSGIPKLFIDEQQITPNGDRIWLRTSKVPLCNEIDETIGVLGIYEDITTYKLLGEKLRASENFLKKAQAIAEVGSYALDVASGSWKSSEELDRMFGIDEAYARSVEGWTALIHPDDRAMMDDYLRNEVLGQGKGFDMDYRIIRHDDHAERWVHGLGKLECNAQGVPIKMFGTIQEITERKLAAIYGKMCREILEILNEPGDIHSSIQRVFAALKGHTGFDAVGIRLQDGEDFPYFSQNGFSGDFLLAENSLIERADGRGVCRDEHGKASLECTCGMVISGKGDKVDQFLTPGGSFWTNDSFPLLDIPLMEDPRHHPRNTCMHEGYASMALVPIRNKDRIVGLIQLNDRRKGCFTRTRIELMERIASHIGEAMVRKRDEQELQEKNAEIEKQNTILHNSFHFIENLVMQSAAPIFVLDSQHRIIFWNRALSRLTGLDSEQMKGTDRHWEAFYPERRPTLADLVLDKAEQDVSKFYDSHDKSRLAEGALSSSGWFQFPGVGKRYLSFHAAPIHNENGEMVAVVETLEDNTETKQIEGMLNDQHRFLQQVLDSLPNPVYYKNRNGAYIGCNRSFEEFFGKEKHFILGKNIADLIPDDLAQIHLNYDRLCMKNDAIQSFEMSLTHADGFPRQVIITKAPLHLGSGKINGLVGAFTDITENKNISRKLEVAYDELKSAQSLVVHQEKMASIGLMAAGVAHEINNPMAFISCNLNSLGKYMERMREYQAALKTHLADFPDNLKQAIDELQRRLKIEYILEDTGNLVVESLDGADRVLKIVQNLKSFSRVDQADEKYADIIQCLESTINVAWNEIKYVATLRKEFGDIPQIRCFPQQLNQVFLNLLVNAAQAISGQGEIVVRTWHDTVNIFVSVSDTGSGIPEDIQRNIFEPFFTTKVVGKGTGLGLSISIDIVRKHGGDLMFATRPDQGTTFTVRLPINNAQELYVEKMQ
jgi:two-component system NtrC family sensor kinase